MLYPVLSAMIIAINVLLGVMVLAASPGRLQNRLFALLCLCFVIWTSSCFMMTSSSDPERALFWARFSFFGVSFIAPLYLHFILSFEDRTVPWHIYLPAFVFAALASLTGLLVPGLHRSAGNLLYAPGAFDGIVYGVLYPAFTVYFIACVSFGAYRSFIQLRELSGIEQARMRLIFLGTVIPGSIGGLTNVVLPAIGVYGYEVAEYFTVVIAAFFFYAFFYPEKKT